MIASYYFVMCDNCSDCQPVETSRDTKKEAVEAYLEEEGTTRHYSKHFCSQECKDEFLKNPPEGDSITIEDVILASAEKLSPDLFQKKNRIMTCTNVSSLAAVSCTEPYLDINPIYEGRSTRQSKTFSKVMDYMTSPSFENRKIGLTVAKSALNLDAYDICHRIKKMAHYGTGLDWKTKELFNVFSGCLDIAEVLGCWFTITDVTNDFKSHTVHIEGYMSISGDYIGIKLPKNALGILQQEEGDFYERLLLCYVWELEEYFREQS